jgi:hypothetical protein
MSSYRTKQILQIAKILRNSDIPTQYKTKLIKTFDELFYEDNSTYDRQRFVAICNSTLTDLQVWNYNRMKSCGDLND